MNTDSTETADMLETFNGLIKAAMKSQQKARLTALRYMKSLLLENKTSAKPIVQMDVIIKHHKKLKDSLKNFPEDNPMYAQTIAEIVIVEEFLPKALSTEEVSNIIANIIKSNENANLGVVMKELTPQIKGRFDGKQASEMVRAALS